MRVAEAVGQGLAKLGADTVFGVVGSGNFHVTNALIAGGARFVAARHEGGATVMADAWARTTGRPGVVSVHQGPGLTNAMTGIAEAAKSRTPLLVLAAEAPEIRSNFHVDVAGLAAAVGAVGGLFFSSYAGMARFDFSIEVGLIGFSAAVVGGLGSMPGAIIGSLLIAGLDTLVQAVVANGASYRLVFVFLLVIAVLVFRPSGLLGRAAVEKV